MVAMARVANAASFIHFCNATENAKSITKLDIVPSNLWKKSLEGKSRPLVDEGGTMLPKTRATVFRWGDPVHYRYDRDHISAE